MIKIVLNKVITNMHILILVKQQKNIILDIN